MFQRIKNLWKLSEYSPSNRLLQEKLTILENKKNTSYIKRNMPQGPATIVDTSPEVDLEEQLEKDEQED